MSSSPFITVIIPSFNAAGTIAKALLSILNQTLRSAEILVMDGHSTDQTMEIVKSFQSDIPIVFVSEKDTGVYDAVNKGIQLAKGKWILVLGSDDIISSPDVFEKAAVFLSESNADLVYGNVKVVGDAGWAEDNQIYDGEFTLEKLLRSNICQQAIFYRKRFFGNVGLFNSEYKICADWEMAFRAFAKGKVQYIPLTITDFYGGGISITRKDERFSADLIENLVQVFGKSMIRREFLPFKFRIMEYGNECRKNFKWLTWWKCRAIYIGLDRLS